MGQGQLGGLPSKQGGIGDRKGDPNNKKEKKYELAALPTCVGKKQRKQKGPETATRLPVVHACHQVQASASKVGSREGLLVDGGGVCGESGAFEAARR
ncbi:unnamed protein product [Sphagnum jensenii]|uniref:Uncharacterized protein n=1 Tax=Sphagnum jensenii TaxID=128206 RepID=A0ABP1BB06_9BRYO